MSTLTLTATDTTAAGVIVEIWERGSAGQPDALVETQTLGAGQAAAKLSLGPTRFAVVREADGSDAKTIDNWSQTPAPAPDA